MRSRTTIALALAASLAGGCAKSVNSVDISSSGQYSWIKTDPMLSNIADITNVNKSFTDAGFLQVQVTLKSHWWDQDVIQYQFTWLDEHGMVLDTPMTGWQRQPILGYQSITLNAVAPDPRCKDVRLEMKRTKI